MSSTFQSAAPLPYKNRNLSIDERVSDLLKRMTLEEKVAQLICIWPRGRDLKPEEMKHGLGQVARQQERKGPREGAAYANATQKYLVENTRLGIPAIFHDEILHGHMGQGSTSFPQPIALASSWDLDLIRQVFTAAALETRVRGSHQVLGPNLDLGRDPRWGRTEETYGEDPYLVSRMGVALIKAIQENGVLATAKHFAAHGQPEAGMNVGPANFSERTLRETFLPSFEAAVKEAGVASVMASYNEIDGVPSHMNSWLLEKVLRQEWSFKGHVVADYYAITQLMDLHRVVGSKPEAAKLALEAGVDIELPDPDIYPHLIQLVKDGKISEATID
ncbi:MAG TPA: glycoside hydrolase family 3 protein, partial [Pyrinomonadaceae bacterium]|nr:glycoside hydrolase family 3 protein [Pyrinomonadaceae bacterium]